MTTSKKGHAWRKDNLKELQPEDHEDFLTIAPRTNLYKKNLKYYYEILTNFYFLAEKINALGVQELIKDYDWNFESEVLEHPEYDPERLKALKLVQGALQLSADILVKDNTQLAGQLWGRLQGYEMPDIQVLLEQAMQSDSTWLRPLTPSLTRPDGRLLRTLNGHTGSVNAVAITPDGLQVISGSSDKTLIVWDLKTGEIERTLNGHTGSVNAVAITPDGLQVISGSSDKTLIVWDLKTGKMERTLTDHTGSVNAIAITSYGKRVISGSSDKTLKVWNLKTGKMKRTLTDHTNSVNASVNAVAVTPDGNQLISHSGKYEEESQTTPYLFKRTHTKNNVSLIGKLIRWNLKTEEKKTFLFDKLKIENARSFGDINPSNLVKGVAVTNGKRVISGSSDNTLEVWNLETGEFERTLEGHTNLVKGVAVTQDGKWVISGSSDKTLIVWNLETGKIKHTLEGHTDEVNAVAVTKDGQQVISGSSDKTLKVWKLEDETFTPSSDSDSVIATAFPFTDHSTSVKAVAVTRNGRCLIKALSDETLKAWDLESREQMFTFHDKRWVNHAFAVTSNGKRVICGLSNGKLKVWNLETGKKLFSLGARFEYYKDNVTFTKRTTRGEDNTVLLNALIFLRFIEDHISFIKATRRGEVANLWWVFIFMICSLGFLEALGAASTAESLSKRCLYFLVSIILFLIMRAWGPLKDAVFSQTEEKPKFHVTVAVTPNREKVISGSPWGTLRVWNLKTKKKLFALTGHTDSVNTVAITPDSRRMISGSSDNTLRVWNLETGEIERTLRGHTESVNAVAVTRDGMWVISGSSDNTLKVWDRETGKELFTLTGHSASINAVVVISDDGKRVISGSSDNTLKVWDLSSRKVIASFTGESEILCCTVASAGMKIVAGEKSGRVHLLQLEEPT